MHADGESWIATQISPPRSSLLQLVPRRAGPRRISRASVARSPRRSAPGATRRWIQDYSRRDGDDAPQHDDAAGPRRLMLAVDQARFGLQANQDLLWQGLRMHGFGQLSLQHRQTNADTNPTPDFSSPMANNATLNFLADNKGEHPGSRNAQIFVGDYQARATQIADTDPSTSPSATPGTDNLDNTAQFAPTTASSLVLAEPAVEPEQLHGGRTGLRHGAFQREDTCSRAKPGTSRSTSRRTSPRRRRPPPSP